MLNINDYNYPLPDERIAKYPLAERDHSKLLIYREGEVSEDHFYDIGKYIPSHSLLIYNNTRVIQARLVFRKQNESGHPGARIEVFCLEPLLPHDYQLNLSAYGECTWKCMIGNLKKWKSGELALSVGDWTLYAERLSTTGNTHTVRFRWDNAQLCFAQVLDALGELPIPPYLNRPTEERDKTTYQTVYSRIKGSVAAPTAGLHFTDAVLDGLRGQGVEIAELTLHVGAGTFQPVKTEDANEHVMHTEIIAVPKKTIQTIIAHLGHIVAVGTTSMRTLESLYFIGAMGVEHVPQFAPYEQEYTLPTAQALQRIVDYLDKTGQDVLHADTQIMIKPGYTFRVVDQLITNFHQPKSTLLLLVSAFVGGDWKTIYDYAMRHDFRFLSYGDSSILFRRKAAMVKQEGMIDTHCHIDDEVYQEDFSGFIARQQAGGVEAIYVPGVDVASIEPVWRVCEQFPQYLFPAIGLHPENVQADYQQQLDILHERLLAHLHTEPVRYRAIGEIGLDYHFDTTYKTEQQDAFRQQLAWAMDYDLPVMIHSRDATEDGLKILKEYPGLRAVMHCYSGSKETAAELVKMGLYIGIGGVITFKNCKLREYIATIPLNRIVLETDAPYMAPVPYRGQTNQSIWMEYVVDVLAQAYGVSKETIKRQTSANAKQLFGIN